MILPDELEGCGLSVYEFRVYAHLASLEQTQQPPHTTHAMAQACQISERQVRRALTSLLEKRLIQVTSRTQQARTFNLTPVPEWSVGPNRSTSPVMRPDRPNKRPHRPVQQSEPKRPTRPQALEHPVKHAKLENAPMPNGLTDRTQTASQAGLDLEEVEESFFQEQDLSSSTPSTPPASQAVRPDRPLPESRTKLLEEAGLLDTALEVCASHNHTVLEHRLAALEVDLTRLGRGKIARALHTSLENATHSRWGYYKAVLATQGTREAVSQSTRVEPVPQTASPQTAHQTAPVKQHKTMAELLASAPLNGTWGR